MDVKNILCFGDSNTWGFVPGAFDPETFYMERYSLSKRWPGIMKEILGEGYHVIEEGLNGRTTNVEYPDIPGRSGVSYIMPCLYSHSPLDIIIVQLGINDLKTIFNRKVSEISEGICEILDLINGTSFGADMQSPPKVLLLSPPPLAHEGYIDQNNELIFQGGMQKSFEFHDYYSEIAKEKGCYYIDLRPVVKYSNIDGLHLDEKGHEILGSIVASKILEIF
tara:strand:- start:145 stop:810 length:666 start_codon:yes stop_codon:yes gene_type:complete